MDIPALTSLLSTSTAALAALHAELGHPPEKLQDALALLADTVRSTVDAQIASVRAEVDDVALQCDALKARAQGLRTALGEEPFLPPLKTGRKKSGEKSAADATETLLATKMRLEKEVAQLQDTYNTRNQQIDTILEHIQRYAPVLEGGSTADMSTDDVAPAPDAEEPVVPPLPERDMITLPHPNPASSSPSAPASAPAPIPTATNAYIQALNAHLNGLDALKTSRAERFTAYLQHIFDLWGTLHLRPRLESDPFERAICRIANIKPVMTHDTVEVEVEDPDRAGEMVLQERVGFRGEFDAMTEEDVALLDAADEAAGGQAPELLASVATLRRLKALICGLEAEKHRREERIQMLYDELFVLWSRFDCDESEMDDFVLENKGLSLDSITAYESELEKMMALKAQHSLTFIRRIREQMTQYSQSARLAQSECEALFPEFFIPLPDPADPMESAGQRQQPAYDGLLAAHEQAIPRILSILEAKGPIMRLVERYEEVCKEEDELAESAKNTARLFAGGKKAPAAGGGGGGAKAEKPKRDPGRLLREEKMRKRVKVLKPKLEAEMLKAIPAWEQEHGEAFMLDGERYMDKLEAIAAARKPATSIPPVSNANNMAGQKRARQGSVGPSPAPTPSGSRVSSLVLTTPLGPSYAHNRAVSSSAVGSAQYRGGKVGGMPPPQTPSHAPPAAKKARLASATGGSAAPAAGRTQSRIAGPGSAAVPGGRTAAGAGAGLGSSVSSHLGRTPAALQGARRAALPAAGVTAALNLPKRAGAVPATASAALQQHQHAHHHHQQQQQQQQPVVTLLPPSAPFRPRPSVGAPFSLAMEADTHALQQQQRIVSAASNTSMATSNAGTVIVHHSVPQRSLFAAAAYAPPEEAEHHVTAPLFFGGAGAAKLGELVGAHGPSGGLDAAAPPPPPPRGKGNRSRPSLSLAKTLTTNPDESGLAPGGGGATNAAASSSSSSSMRLVTSEIARRLGVVGGAAGAGGAVGARSSNWDRLVEEDDLEEEDLVMANVAEEDGEDEEEGEEEEDAEVEQGTPPGAVHLLPVADEEIGVRRSARVAATAH